MPANVSEERKQLVAAFGAEVVLSDSMEGSDGAIRLCRELIAEDPDRYFYPDQYNNPANPLAHFNGTGAEIMRPMAVPVLGGVLLADEVIDVFIPVFFAWLQTRRWRRLR